MNTTEKPARPKLLEIPMKREPGLILVDSGEKITIGNKTYRILHLARETRYE